MKINLVLVVVICLTNLFFGQNNSSSLDHFNFYSEIRSREYEIKVYMTENYDVNNPEKYPSIYFQDGFLYLTNIKATTHFANLYNENKIGDFVAIFIKPDERSEELAFFQKGEFSSFIATELVPFIDSSYNTSNDPAKRIMMGLSYGGNLSAYLCYRYPNVFRNCALQSAAFRPMYDVFNLYFKGEKRDIDFYAIWGTDERPIDADMRRYRDALIDKGYSFIWEEHDGEGHTFGFWESRFEDMIEYFLNKVDVVSVNDEIILDHYKLFQNYPNPFNPSTTIKYSIPSVETHNHASVQLVVYDILGKEVATLVNKEQQPGSYEVKFNASDLPSGIYFYKISDGSFIETKKMLLLK